MEVTPLLAAAHRKPRSLPAQVRVLVVEPQEVAQIGLRALFGTRDWVDRCFVTDDVAVATSISRRHTPNLALVSMQLEGVSGLRACSDLRAAAPNMRILLLSTSGSVDARRAEQSGADAVVMKSAPAAQLLDASRALLEGRRIERTGTPGLQSPRRLSPRESQVLEMLSEGLSNPEIAETLHLSHNTVKQHTSALYRKLGVKNRAQAARIASAQGLVA